MEGIPRGKIGIPAGVLGIPSWRQVGQHSWKIPAAVVALGMKDWPSQESTNTLVVVKVEHTMCFSAVEQVNGTVMCAAAGTLKFLPIPSSFKMLRCSCSCKGIPGIPAGISR